MSTWRSRHDTSQQSFRVWFWVWMGCKRNLKGRREKPVVMFWRSELDFKGHAPPTHTRTHWLVWSTSLLEKGSSWALSTLLGPSPSACPHPGADRHAGSQQRLPVSAPFTTLYCIAKVLCSVVKGRLKEISWDFDGHVPFPCHVILDHWPAQLWTPLLLLAAPHLRRVWPAW